MLSAETDHPDGQAESHPAADADAQPRFISVTFGAGGSAGGVSTAEVADYIQNELQIPTLAHLICMGNDQIRAAEILDQLEAVGVRDVLALRGDRSPTRPESPDFRHASDLTSFIKWKKPDFSVHGACTRRDTPRPTPCCTMLRICGSSRPPVPSIL
ncbi:MAG: methylenetetrahydrofolate reductase [Gemmiger sp.]